MDTAEYFEVKNEEQDIINIKLKGFWNKSIVEEISDSLYKTVKSIVESLNGSQFIVLADLSYLKTPTPETKEAIGRVMKYCLEHGLYKSIQVLPKSIVKMSITQTAAKVSTKDFRVVVDSIEEAHKLIDEIRIVS